jgi:Cysteine-rich secretory protein family
MRILQPILVLSVALSMPAFLVRAQSDAQSAPNPYKLQPEAIQLVNLANQARAKAGVGPLHWDPALAAAARQHCILMAIEGPIAHQYPGELDLASRAAKAGAHFSLIEENVAIGTDPAAIQEEWMHSPGHRANLLNPEVDRVGIAVVASRGVLYAVADYSHAVRALNQTQVEAAIANLIRPSGVTILADPTVARSYCATNHGPPGSAPPDFIMIWQGPELTVLPEQLVTRLASGRYHRAAIGNCTAQKGQGDQSAFSAYRIAVLLF